MRKSSRYLIAAIALILVALIFIVIALTPISQSANILNTSVAVQANAPYVYYGVSAYYYLNGNGNGKISGTLQSLQCCVDFYIFVDTAWNNWVLNNLTITNSSNSPALTASASSIDSPAGTSFSFVPNPSATYILTFFNENRSLWRTNSTAVSHVSAHISISYPATPAKSLIYPGVGLIVVGAILIFMSRRNSK